MADLLGKCDDRFEAVRAALARNLDSGEEIGSMILMDTGRRVTLSYIMNKMGPGIIGSERSTEYGQAIYDAVTS